MCFYLRGSLPWHVAKKWRTCISLLGERICTIWVALVWDWMDLGGVFCESWIKFKALCFALFGLSNWITDQGIMGIESNFGKNSSHRAVPVLNEYLAGSLAAFPRKELLRGNLGLDVLGYEKPWDLVVIA